MGSYGFADIESERGAIAENEARVRASNLFRQMSTPTLATTVSAVSEMYPNISSSVVLAGAVGGVSPTDDVWAGIDAQERAMREERWVDTGFEPLDYLADVAQGTYGLIKGTTRAGMIAFDTIWEEGLAHPLRTTVVDYQNQGEANWASSWGEASPSSGLRLAQQFFGDPTGNIGSSVANYMNLFIPFADPFEVETDSRVNMGSGWFANSDIVEANDARVRALVATGMSDRDAMVSVTNDDYGSPSTLLFREGADSVQVHRGTTSTGVSPGRLGAMLITEPGTAEFNVLSGTMDLGAQIFLDPSNYLLMGAGKVRKASRAMQVFDNQSGLVNGIRRSVLQSDVDKALNSSIGQGSLRFLSETDDLALIDSVISPATRSGQASTKLLREIQVTDTVDGMFNVIRQATGGEIVRKPWNYSATSAMLGGSASGTTVRRRLLNTVNRSTELIVASKTPNYGGFRPSLKTRYLDGSIIYDAPSGRISRGSTGRNRRAVSRLFSQMSGDRIDISNMNAGFSEVRKLARSLDLNPEDTQRALSRWVQLENNDIGGATEVVESMMGAYRKKLYLSGVSEETADKMTTIYKTQDEMRRYFVDASGDIQDPGVFTMLLGNGESISTPMAHTLAEMSGNFIPVPGDPRMIRRMTDYIKRSDGVLTQAGAASGSAFYKKDFSSRVAVRGADRFMAAWRPMVLLRPAWTIRVVGEEQTRMAAADLHAFNHPMRAFIAAVSDKNLQLGMTTRRNLLKSDVYGDAMSLATDYQKAMSKRSGTWFDSPGGYSGERWIKIEMDHKDYDKWWFREINQLQSDKATSSLARMLTDSDDPAKTLADVKASFWDGELAAVRNEIVNGGGSVRHRGLNTEEGANAYIDSLNARLHLKTGGSYEVLKDDGWWYSDAGARLRQANEQDQSILGRAAGLGGGTKTGQKAGSRIKTRTFEEYRSALSRSGMSDADVERKIRYLQAKNVQDDLAFSRLDADARTVLIDSELITETDMLSEARTVQFRVVRRGNDELIGAVGTGRYRNTYFGGEINKNIESRMMAHLRELRGSPKGRDKLRRLGGGKGADDAFVGGSSPAELAARTADDVPFQAPQYVKGVDESDVGMLDGTLDRAFDMFMGKQTNRFSRSPVFMRSYWNTITDLADQGLLDPRTVRRLETLLGKKGGKSLSTRSTRKALRHSELVDEHVRSTERFLFELEDNLSGTRVIDPDAGDDAVRALGENEPLPDDLAEILRPTLDRLANLLESPAYDVGKYDRIIGDIGRDLDEIGKKVDSAVIAAEKQHAKAVAAANKEAGQAPKAYAEKLEDLRAAQRDISERIQALEKLESAEDVESLGRLYGAMDNMPPGYVDGLDPYPGTVSESPSSLEEAIEQQLINLRKAEGEPEVAYRTVRPAPEVTPGTMAESEKAVERSKAIDDFGPLPQATRVKTGTYELETPFGTVGIVKRGNSWVVMAPQEEFRVGLKSKKYASKTKAREAVRDVITDEAIRARGFRKEMGEKVRSETRWPEGAERHVDEATGAEKISVPEKLPAEEAVPIEQIPEIAFEEGVVERAFNTDELQKLRHDLKATEDEIRTLAEARIGGIADIEKVGMDKVAGQHFEQELPGRPNQLMSMEEADSLAKAAALTQTQDLLYDLSKRSNFSDMMRNIFPFSEAWWEIASTWTKLIQGNPRVVRRFQQAYDGLKEDVLLPESAFNIEGHDGHGFFYVDPKTNKEMFAIPYLSSMLQGNELAGAVLGGATGAGLGGMFFGSGAAVAGGLAGAAAGALTAKAGLVPEGESVDLAFSAQGVNMMTGSVMPGIGPLASVPVSWLLNVTGAADPIKELFLPFGEPKTGSVGDFIDSTFPSWARKFVTAVGGGDENMKRLRANTTMEVAGMMVRRGEGSFDSQENIKKTIDSASQKSGWLYAIRGLAAFAGPTAPSFTYDTQDKNGAWFFTQTLVSEWRKMVDAHSGDEVSAFEEFVGLYGIMPQTFMTGKTVSLVSAPVTKDAYAWKGENEEIYDKYPGTAYLLDPTDPLDEEFSYDAYIESLEEGTRVAYTPTQWAEKSNQLAGNIIMERFRQSADAFLAESPHRSADQVKVDRQMYALQDSLAKEYPGYGRQIYGEPNRMSTEQKLDEIRHWSPAMKASEIGVAVNSYILARDEAENIGIKAGYSKNWWRTSSSPEAVRIRDELIAIGVMLYRQEPGFKTAWHTLFASEIRNHIEESN